MRALPDTVGSGVLDGPEKRKPPSRRQTRRDRSSMGRRSVRQSAGSPDGGAWKTIRSVRLQLIQSSPSTNAWYSASVISVPTSSGLDSFTLKIQPSPVGEELTSAGSPSRPALPSTTSPETGE